MTKYPTHASECPGSDLPPDLGARVDLLLGAVENEFLSHPMKYLGAYEAAYALLPAPPERWKLHYWLAIQLGDHCHRIADCHALLRDQGSIRDEDGTPREFYRKALRYKQIEGNIPARAENAFYLKDLGDIHFALGERDRARDLFLRVYRAPSGGIGHFRVDPDPAKTRRKPEHLDLIRDQISSEDLASLSAPEPTLAELMARIRTSSFGGLPESQAVPAEDRFHELQARLRLSPFGESPEHLVLVRALVRAENFEQEIAAQVAESPLGRRPEHLALVRELVAAETAAGALLDRLKAAAFGDPDLVREERAAEDVARELRGRVRSLSFEESSDDPVDPDELVDLVRELVSAEGIAEEQRSRVNASPLAGASEQLLLIRDYVAAETAAAKARAAASNPSPEKP